MGRLTIPAASRVYFDTSPFIYSVEKHTEYWPVLEEAWQEFENDEFSVVTSNLTLHEVLVLPIRAGDQPLIDDYEKLLTNSSVELVPITTDILRDAASIRAKDNLKTPDAIHVATAIASGCDHLVTNDDGFRRLSKINIVLLSDLK